MALITSNIGKEVVDQWHVRDENGGVFGPVDFSALKIWVEDGRVSPASEVSSDGEKWVLAILVPEFEMNCVAEIEPGSFYGPIHRNAMRGLVAAGSISADAMVYCKELEAEKTELPQSIEGVSQEEYNAALDKLASVENEKSVVEVKLQSATSELDALIALYESEKKAGCDLSGAVDGLQRKVERLSGAGEDYRAQIKLLQSEGEDYKALINSLQGEVAVYQSDLAASRSATDEIILKHQAEISALNEMNDGLKVQIKEFNTELDDFKVEIEDLRENNRDQIKLLEERDRLYEAELKEKESACNLKIDDVILEHKSAINMMKNQSGEEIQCLQNSNMSLQQRLKELEQTNRGLKEEFVKYEELQSCSSLNDAAQRKLIVMKKLFAEAALLLDTVDNAPEKEMEGAQDEIHVEVLEPELIDYDEVTSEEGRSERIAPAVTAEPIKASIYRKSTVKKSKTPKSKDEKKWSFGRSRKSMGHDSLAELEAQAQVELQRLSSSQGISAIFNKKK